VKAIVMNGFGEAEVLALGEIPDPVPGPGELLVRIRATALNRADLLQRQGHYPPPAGAPATQGLEMSGEVAVVGPGCAGWKVGERVCALLPGGGYAQFVTIPADMALPVPRHLSHEQAAAIPEVFLTAYLNLFRLGGLTPEKSVLIHAGASGVGTAAIQLVRAAGARSWVTAGTLEKIQSCIALGAVAGWDHHQGSFVPWVMEQTRGRGVDLILDFIGAPYLADNLQALAQDGRLNIIGTLGGAQAADFNLGTLMAKRLTIQATTLRSQSVAAKVALNREFRDFAWPRFASQELVPLVDRVFGWTEAAQAHRYMESNANTGKIVLRVD